jgi:hypothetical protein
VRTTCIRVHFGRGAEALKVRSGSAEVVGVLRIAIEGRVGSFAGIWSRSSVDGRIRRRREWRGIVGPLLLM